MPLGNVKTRIPMLKTLGRFAFVDDAKDYLEALELTLEPRATCYFVAPADFGKLDAMLAQTRNLLRKEQELLLHVSRAQAGDEANLEFTAARRALAYFAEPCRLDMVIGLFSDYSMPVEDGISLCAKYKMTGLQRTLLTGIAEERKAIEAFNAGAIETYMPKSVGPLYARILEQIASQTIESGARRGELLQASVGDDLLNTLANPAAGEALTRFLEQHGITEHILLGSPQGLLGITEHGHAIWIQLETASSFAQLLEEVTTSDVGWSSEVIERIATRRSIIAEAFMGQLGRRATEHDAQIVCDAPYLAAGVFPLRELPPEFTPAARQPSASAAA